MRQIGVEVIGIIAAQAGSNLDKRAYEACVLAGEDAKPKLLNLGISESRADDLIAKTTNDFLHNAAMCESKIEQVALGAMSHMVLEQSYPPAVHNLNADEPFPDKPVVIVPQFSFGRYRLDFFVRAGGHSFAVECDGSDFHYSREARERDARRDSDLKAAGVTTLRFGGQDLWRTSGQAVSVRIFNSLLEARRG